jgi:DNA-binding NarL/FixJ family response regulator
VTQQSVLLIGEHNLLRAFLRAWLGRFDDLRVGAESSDASHAVEMVRKHKPALVLMDFDTLQAASLEVLAKIRSAYPLVKVIIYFAYSNDQVAFKVMRAGASGFVVKDAQSEDMENAIKTVMGGGVYLSTQFLKSLGSAEGVADKEGKTLSPRQGEILKMIALGMSTKDVAFELKISAKTVDVHKQALMNRVGVKSTTGLVKFAIRSGLVPA